MLILLMSFLFVLMIFIATQLDYSPKDENN